MCLLASFQYDTPSDAQVKNKILFWNCGCLCKNFDRMTLALPNWDYLVLYVRPLIKQQQLLKA
jgi:hypothetical protein